MGAEATVAETVVEMFPDKAGRPSISRNTVPSFKMGAAAWTRYARALYLAAFFGAAASLFAYHHSSIISLVNWEILATYDFGNAMAALVAVGGYLLEHYISRKASQLEKQMERVEAQMAFLVPVTLEFHALWQGAVTSFIDKCVGQYLTKGGRVEHLGDYEAMFEQSALGKSAILESPTALVHPVSRAMTFEVMFAVVESGTRPRVTSKTELPLLLHNAIRECDRESKLWKSYEAFVRHSLLPGVERIAEIINESGHLMEPVSADKMRDIFGTTGTGYGEKWVIAPRMFFYSRWVAYARSWQELIAVWDDGDKDEMRPAVDFPIGLLFFNVEAQGAVARVEQELIGASQMHGHRR